MRERASASGGYRLLLCSPPGAGNLWSRAAVRLCSITAPASSVVTSGPAISRSAWALIRAAIGRAGHRSPASRSWVSAPARAGRLRQCEACRTAPGNPCPVSCP